MKIVDLYIRKYDWSVRFYLNTIDIDSVVILSYLYNNGFGLDTIKRVDDHVAISGPNTGFTTSSDGRSVVVVSNSTSRTEFFNTLIHELKHLVDFISAERGIIFTSEESA